MLPLRASESVKKFPVGVLSFIGFLIILQVLTYLLGDGSRGELVASWALKGQGFLGLRHFLSGLFLHENFFALWISCVYLWSFAPRLFERRPYWLVVPGALLSTLLSAAVYFLYHGPLPGTPILLGQVFVSALLGIAMRGEIWSNINTLVFGPKLMQVFEVPSYVLLFFWFFYIMLGNLFMSAPFSDAPTLYFFR